MSTLIVLLPPREPAVPLQEWQWPELPFALVDKSGHTQRAGRAALALLPQAATTVLIVAARDLLMLEQALPPLKGPRLKQALPNIIEDQLIQDPQGCHIAVDPAALDGGRSVLAVIDRAWFKFIVDAFTAAGHRHLRAVPVTRCLPPATRRDAAAAAETEAVADVALGEGFAAPVSSAVATLEALANGTPLELYELGEPGAEPQLASVRPLDDKRLLPGAAIWPFDALVRRALDSRFDLCQFEFEFAPWRFDRATFMRLRLPLALAATTLAIAVIGANAHWWKLSRERDALAAQITETLLSTFPKTTTVLDPAAQMTRQLDRLRIAAGELSPNDFLSLASGLARSLGPLPPNGIASLDYHDRRLDVGFKPETKVDPDFAQRLARNGLTGEIDSSTGKWTIRSRS